MSQQFLSEFEIARSFVKNARSRVPEGMKSRFSRSASNSQPVQNWIEHIFADYVWMKRRTLFGTKDEVLWGFVGCLLKVCGEHFGEHIPETG